MLLEIFYTPHWSDTVKAGMNALKNRAIATLLLCLAMGSLLNAQPYYFNHYQVESGLSHNSVICLLQDEEGFMWFGTKDGLNRFDGYTFKVFRHDPEDATSIGNNFIQALYQHGGKLWVGTSKGLYHYDTQSESFYLLKETINSSIRDIHQDAHGNLWFIAGSTLYQYTERKELLQSYDPQHYFAATSIGSTIDGKIWVSTDAGSLNQYDPVRDSFVSFNLFDQSPPTSSHWIEEIYATGKRSILVGTRSQGVKLFDTFTGTYHDILTHDRNQAELFVRNFVQSANNEYWIATESGVYVYNLVTGEFTNLQKSHNDPYSLSDNAVYSLGIDQEGGIWAGTYFGGLNYYPKQYTPFEKFFPQQSENSISGNAVREICQDKYGNIWIGTEDAGLNKLDPESGVFTHFGPSNTETGLSYKNVHSLLARGNELWIGTFEHGLDVMDIRTGKVIRHYGASPRPGALKSNFIHTLHQTRSGQILLGTSMGVYRYNRASDDFTALPQFPSSYHYTALFDDHAGTLWAGTYHDGLYYYNESTGWQGFHQADPDNQNSLSSNSINGIFADHQEKLWITTDGGLSVHDPTQGNFVRYTTKDGLPSDMIYSILEDEKNKLWISTSKGLVHYDPATASLKVYTQAHGLLSDQFNYSSAYQDPKGTLYFGSVNGLIRFNPAEFIRNILIPPVRITGFQIDNQDVAIGTERSPLKKSITYTDRVILTHRQSSFSLDFAALHFTAPDMTEYRYNMVGLDEEWTYLKTNRKVYFTKLAPGEYTFLVKAANSSGLWNDTATQLTIEIIPPFWASPWAYLLYACFAIWLIYYGARAYHRKTERKNRRKIKLLEIEKEKEVYQAKIQFFTNVAHEIRTPLTLIKGPLENLVHLPGTSPKASSSLRIMEKNVDRLLELANQLLDFRKTEAEGFSLTFIKVNISDLLEETYSRFYPAAEQKNIAFTIDLPEAPLFAYVDAEALIKILSNLFSNAVKYAGTTANVRLDFTRQEDQTFAIRVTNDGSLIPVELRNKVFEPFYRLDETAKETGTGIGLSLARSLAELHQGTLKLLAPDSSMNTFALILPVHQEKEFEMFEAGREVPRKAVVAEEETPEKAYRKPVILLVEDNQDMRHFIAGELDDDYHVLPAADGEEALRMLNNNTVHLVISDIMMPGIDGFEVCKQVKMNLDHSHIPIILLTAKNTLQSRIEGLESGADAYIEKPFSPEHLRVQVANLLTNRSKIKEHFASSPLAHLSSMAYSKTDESFLDKLNQRIDQHMADPNLNVEYLAEMMNMSRPTLYRKIKALSDLTPNELINIARLKKAAELLMQGDHKIYEVAEAVGYSSPTSFGRNFQKQFGMTPSDYANAKEATGH